MYSIDPAVLENETDVETYTAGGPGGQHRNKTQSAVRLKHRPSGIVVSATERRSQSANLKVAFERLRARLIVLNTPVAPRFKTKPSRASKRRRLSDKSHHSRKKQERRSRDD